MILPVELRNSTIIEGTLDSIDYQNKFAPAFVSQLLYPWCASNGLLFLSSITLENASYHHPFVSFWAAFEICVASFSSCSTASNFTYFAEGHGIHVGARSVCQRHPRSQHCAASKPHCALRCRQVDQRQAALPTPFNAPPRHPKSLTIMCCSRKSPAK